MEYSNYYKTIPRVTKQATKKQEKLKKIARLNCSLNIPCNHVVVTSKRPSMTQACHHLFFGKIKVLHVKCKYCLKNNNFDILMTLFSILCIRYP